MSTNPIIATSYTEAGPSGQRQFELDTLSLEKLDLQWAIPTAHHPNVSKNESQRVLLGEGKIGSVWRYHTLSGIPRAYKVITPKNVPGFHNIRAATDLRLSDFILNAKQAEETIDREKATLHASGYEHVIYEELKESYIPCQEINVGAVLSWLSSRANFMQLGDTSKLEESLLEQIKDHRGGLVSLINNIAEFINQNYVANHYTKVQAIQYAKAYGLPEESIREFDAKLNGHEIKVFQVPLLPFDKIFPEHIQAGLNDQGEWFTVMELLSASMGDTIDDVASEFEKAAANKKAAFDVVGIMNKIEKTFDFKELQMISLMLDFIHICGLTISDLKPDNITHDLNEKLVIADLSAMQKIGGRRIYGSPKYMTPESFQISQSNPNGLIGREEDDNYALKVIKQEWEDFLNSIPEFTEKITLQKYMESQKRRRKDSENMTMELILASRNEQ